MTSITTINPATMNNVDLQAEAKRLGIEFTPDVARNDLIKAVAIKHKELKESGGGNASQDNSGDKNVVYYWIKMQSYIDDDTMKSDKLLPVGLYKFNKVLKRLEGSPKTAVEKFEGEIPERALIDIAKAVGINYDASDTVDYADLQSKLLSEVKFK